MSRLKFRAWDKSKQKMYTTSELIIWDNKVYANDIRVLTHEILNGWEIEEDYLMQSTGILDHNGVEIFEGDILELEDGGEVLGNAKLVWNKWQATLVVEAIGVEDATAFSELIDDISSYRVIGNIYENPEYDQNFVGVRIEGKKR